MKGDFRFSNLSVTFLYMIICAFTNTHITVHRYSEGPPQCLLCLLILLNFIQLLFLLRLFSFFPLFFLKLESVLFETLLSSKNQQVLSCRILFTDRANSSTDEQVSVSILFSATSPHFKEPSSLRNLIFMLVGVNVMTTSNFDANSKKMRETERILPSRIPG